MKREELFEKIIEICRDVFNAKDYVFQESTSAVDVDEWDSLTHLTMINEIEETYGVAFTLDEVIGSRNIGELLDALMRHIAEK